MLSSQNSSLKSALSSAEREVRSLSTELERAQAVAVQLEAARNEAAHANSHLELALSRSALLERAWVADRATALAIGKVRCYFSCCRWPCRCCCCRCRCWRRHC